MHESRYTIVRIVSRAVYPYRLAVGSSYNKFFAPVTKDISRETRRTLSGVAGVAACGRKERCESSVIFHF